MEYIKIFLRMKGWHHIRSLTLTLGEDGDNPYLGSDVILSFFGAPSNQLTRIRHLYLQSTNYHRKCSSMIDNIIQILSLSPQLTWLSLSRLHSDNIPLLVPHLTRVKRSELSVLLTQEKPSTVALLHQW
jgi:hypothetical protein